jgi:ABC-2 type transport system permease protein
MNPVLTVARKELRGIFGSAVAVIFLGVFLVVTLFCFFSYEGFFARNLADVRPLFEWLPILLIFLVSAVTMRQWAEEKRMGTLEVLLTLPLRTTDLVLGKFLAGLALVGLALMLTLPLPVTVSRIGDLDWGPVVGGYVAALLLASTYLAIGLCVSARTDNQVVSLMVTLVIGGILYLVGTDRVTAWFSQDIADVLRAIGSGSRFHSIERGVLDVRDLVYYVSIAGFFLALNVYFLEAQRLDPDAASGSTKNAAMISALGLLALNVAFANTWLAPLSRLRVDLTERGDYTLSEVTKDTLRDLDEPLVITGYFSERTHKYLAPLIPQLEDFLQEYAVHGNGKVTVEFKDPLADKALEQEINEQYGIKSAAFPVEDQNEQAIVNAYFDVLVKYGDKFEVLSYEDLIEINQGQDGIEVKLRNPEYDVTRSIRKVTQEFLSLEAILAKIDPSKGAAKLTLYVSEKTVPKDFAEMPAKLRKVAQDLAASSGGRLAFQEVDPSTDPPLQDQLAQKYGIQPLAVDLFGREVFWMSVLLEVGGRTERMTPPGDISEAEVKEALTAAIKRAAPGQVTRVALYSPTPPAPPQNPNMPPQYQPPPPRPDFTALEDFLKADYQVERIDLADGYVPEDDEVLIVAKPGEMTDKQLFAVDQFLMRGGKVLAFDGAYQVDASQAGITAKPGSEGLQKLLETYGVKVDKSFVMDPQNTPFPVPVTENVGGMQMRRVQMMPYPFFADIRPSGMAQGHAALVGLNNATVPWGSPLTLTAPEGVKAEALLSTSKGSWVRTESSLDPDFTAHPDLGFAPTGETGSRIVAATLEGTFPSAFADKPSPLMEGAETATGSQGTGRTLKKSLPDAKLAVIGSNEFLSDLIVGIGQQLRGQLHLPNAQLVVNLLDWSVEDTELASIRSAGAYARTLEPLDEKKIRTFEITNYAAVLLGMAAVVVLPRRLRRRSAVLTPMPSTKEQSA